MTDEIDRPWTALSPPHGPALAEIDTAAVRGWIQTGRWRTDVDTDEVVLALCAALDAARAEQHRCVKRASGIWSCEYSGCCVDGTCCTCCAVADEMRERAQQAEAKLDAYMTSFGRDIDEARTTNLTIGARAERAEAAIAEILRRCDVREDENPYNEPGKRTVPSWIAVADVRNAAGVRSAP